MAENTEKNNGTEDLTAKEISEASEKATENKTEENGQLNKQKMTKRHKFKIVMASLLVLGGNLLIFLMIWIFRRYDDVQFDQILYQLLSPAAGTNKDLVGDAMITVVLYGFLCAGAQIFLYATLAGRAKKLFGRFKSYIKYSASKVAAFLRKRFMPIASAFLVISVTVFIFGLNIHAYIANSIRESDLIEEEYVFPDKVDITFKEKRNLIYIFLESMENTFADPSVGGNITNDFIPELTELANQNVSFTGENGKYGAYSYVGTRWTAAALFAQTSGIVVKLPLSFDFYGSDGTYMPNITTLGDILEKEGYQQTVLFGSDGKFAARDVYFKEHGNFNIIDIYDLNEVPDLLPEPEDDEELYWKWWGCEDKYIFEHAKTEILRLAASGQPFNFMTLTADTHFPDGCVCDMCGNEYEEQYANVIACSSKQVYEFVEWIKSQEFYENTTIVISGDHLTMDPKFLSEIDEDYVRTTYNCIINPAVEPVRENNREFGTFDMFPTTLAAMGAVIEGDRLAIGTNLFSDVDTLTEKYGYDKLEEELNKRSDFYLETFYSEEPDNIEMKASPSEIKKKEY